jgi:hypothetical protein
MDYSLLSLVNITNPFGIMIIYYNASPNANARWNAGEQTPGPIRIRPEVTAQDTRSMIPFHIILSIGNNNFIINLKGIIRRDAKYNTIGRRTGKQTHVHRFSVTKKCNAK